MMFVSGLLTMIANGIGELNLSGEFAIVLGLILGEVSKALNQKYGNIK